MKKILLSMTLLLASLSNVVLADEKQTVLQAYQSSFDTPQYHYMIEKGKQRILELDTQYKQMLKETNRTLASAPPLTVLEIVGVFSNTSGWTYVTNVNDISHPYNVNDIIAIHTIEYGYGHIQMAKFNGSILDQVESNPILDSSNIAIGWEYAYIITDWAFMADNGTATYESHSINSPWNKETDSLYIP
ncbi:DUF4879 domain-containing protein [Shewanella surugensis]|uniref:YolA family protein n=1 Tax=Shewanella surugensis TaxID=212020 RepID=A0ABT0LBV1_9GAMM|nr:DUF4879 domain-containing protein [Shewanella surugensis]MCL1125144.1 YolA family protein [Shewanella surugensis]